MVTWWVFCYLSWCGQRGSGVEATGTYLGVAIGLGVVAGHGEWVVVVGGRSSVATVGTVFPHLATTNVVGKTWLGHVTQSPKFSKSKFWT